MKFRKNPSWEKQERNTGNAGTDEDNEPKIDMRNLLDIPSEMMTVNWISRPSWFWSGRTAEMTTGAVV